MSCLGTFVDWDVEARVSWHAGLHLVVCRFPSFTAALQSSKESTFEIQDRSFSFNSKPPLLLQIYRESRDLALKTYKRICGSDTVEGKDLTANRGTVTTVLLECKNCLKNEEHTHHSIYARRVSRVCEPHDTDHITLLQYFYSTPDLELTLPEMWP